MKFFLAVSLALLACSVTGDVITPPDCSSGGGSATGVTVEVTDLSGSPPYTMSSNKVYTVTFTFTPSQNAPAGAFTVSAEPTVLVVPLPIQIQQNTTQTNAFVQGQQTTVSLNFSISSVFAIFVNQATFFGEVVDGNHNTVVCKTGDVKITL